MRHNGFNCSLLIGWNFIKMSYRWIMSAFLNITTHIFPAYSRSKKNFLLMGPELCVMFSKISWSLLEGDSLFFLLDFEQEHDVLNDLVDPASDEAIGPRDNDNYMQEALQNIREYQQGLMQNQHVNFVKNFFHHSHNYSIILNVLHSSSGRYDKRNCCESISVARQYTTSSGTRGRSNEFWYSRVRLKNFAEVSGKSCQNVSNFWRVCAEWSPWWNPSILSIFSASRTLTS